MRTGGRLARWGGGCIISPQGCRKEGREGGREGGRGGRGEGMWVWTGEEGDHERDQRGEARGLSDEGRERTMPEACEMWGAPDGPGRVWQW